MFEREMEIEKTSFEPLLESMERGIPHNIALIIKELLWKGDINEGGVVLNLLDKKQLEWPIRIVYESLKPIKCAIKTLPGKKKL